MAKSKINIGNKMTLDILPKGYKAKVINIQNMDKVLKRRLMDMGITEGVQVKIKKVAPLGDPVDIEIRGYELCLRKKDLALIDVEVIKWR